MPAPMPSRRGLIAASAWTVPAVVLASSAPAFANSEDASSKCVPTEYLFDWANSGWTAGAGAGTGVVLGSGVARAVIGPTITPAVNMLVSSRMTRDMVAHSDAATGTNMRVSPGQVGDTGGRGLTLYQRHGAGASGRGSGSAQTLTFTFPQQAVKGLAFTITDIDGSAGQFHDRVSLSVPPAEVTHASREVRLWDDQAQQHVIREVPTTQGAGTATSPFSSVRTTAVDNVVSDDGNVEVRLSTDTAIGTFSLTFWNGVTGSLSARGQQAIYLSNMRFVVDVC